MNENVAAQSDRGVALQRYEALMAHLRGDQEIFWKRFGFTLLAEVVALGFFFSLFIESIRDPVLAKSFFGLAALWGLCAVGILMVLLFDRLYFITAWWIERWLSTLKSIEPVAFGDIEVFRNATAPGGARQSARHILVLFGVLWAVLALAVLWRAVAAWLMG